MAMQVEGSPAIPHDGAAPGSIGDEDDLSGLSEPTADPISQSDDDSSAGGMKSVISDWVLNQIRALDVHSSIMPYSACEGDILFEVCSRFLIMFSPISPPKSHEKLNMETLCRATVSVVAHGCAKLSALVDLCDIVVNAKRRRASSTVNDVLSNDTSLNERYGTWCRAAKSFLASSVAPDPTWRQSISKKDIWLAKNRVRKTDPMMTLIDLIAYVFIARLTCTVYVPHQQGRSERFDFLSCCMRSRDGIRDWTKHVFTRGIGSCCFKFLHLLITSRGCDVHHAIKARIMQLDIDTTIIFAQRMIGTELSSNDRAENKGDDKDVSSTILSSVLGKRFRHTSGSLGERMLPSVQTASENQRRFGRYRSLVESFGFVFDCRELTATKSLQAHQVYQAKWALRLIAVWVQKLFIGVVSVSGDLQSFIKAGIRQTLMGVYNKAIQQDTNFSQYNFYGLFFREVISALGIIRNMGVPRAGRSLLPIAPSSPHVNESSDVVIDLSAPQRASPQQQASHGNFMSGVHIVSTSCLQKSMNDCIRRVGVFSTPVDHSLTQCNTCGVTGALMFRPIPRHIDALGSVTMEPFCSNCAITSIAHNQGSAHQVSTTTASFTPSVDTINVIGSNIRRRRSVMRPRDHQHRHWMYSGRYAWQPSWHH